MTVTRSGYGKPDAQEVFESFFGTRNPFADFGFNDRTPFGTKLKKPGPKKADAVVQDLPLTLEELFNGCSKRLAITRKVRLSPWGEKKGKKYAAAKYAAATLRCGPFSLIAIWLGCVFGATEIHSRRPAGGQYQSAVH